MFLLELQSSLQEGMERTEATIETHQATLIKMNRSIQELQRLISLKLEKEDMDRLVSMEFYALFS